jgi:Na+-transporting NADH:ubiquinone oxidoreductase subunit NqrF
LIFTSLKRLHDRLCKTLLAGQTATLCVRRATYWDETTNAEDPAKKGICSNYLCDAKPGADVMMTGPTGQVMLLPKVGARRVQLDPGLYFAVARFELDVLQNNVVKSANPTQNSDADTSCPVA